MASKGNLVKALIDQGLPPVQADMRRFYAALNATSATSDAPPAAASSALRSAHDHALAAEQALLHANSGHILLIPGGGQAVRGFRYLADGLASLQHALGSTGAGATRDLATARGLLDRSGEEFYKADRALGCPYGCQKPKVVKVP